jgi:hypothetical protein
LETAIRGGGKYIEKPLDYLEEVCDAALSNGGAKGSLGCANYGSADKKT